MTAYFEDKTNRSNPRKVVLYSKDGQYYCESKQHLIKEVAPYTYVCKKCKKEYMGPLLVK